MAEALYHEEIYRSPDALARLAEFPVVICGAGALGANITENLARQGFRRLTVIDRDRIEERNLSTQPWYRSEIGAFKARALANNLYRALGVEVNARAEEMTAENARKLLDPNVLIVDTFDNSVGRKVVMDVCLAADQACLHAGLSADYGEVIWNEVYRAPSAAKDDVCDYPLARNLVMLTVSIACETIVSYALTGMRYGYTVTLRDFAVRQV